LIQREDERSVSEDDAFRGLYEREAQAVFQTVYLLCRDRPVAQDATQEAFARALERWGRLRDRSWAGGWVTTTAVNLARRALRRHRSTAGPSDPEPDIDEAVDLWRAVKALPIRQQQATVLRYRADLTMEEIGAAMGCDPGTVRTHIQRARKTLRTQMGEIDVRQ
jgi:RNA polymerase sigma-70 factor (ECF subfamily)